MDYRESNVDDTDVVKDQAIAEYVQVLRTEGRVTYKLSYPIEWADGKTIETVTLRRPRAKDIKHLDGNSGLYAMYKVLSKVSNLSIALVEELDAKDAGVLVDLLGGVLVDFPKDWRSALGNFARIYHFGSVELLNFGEDEIIFWSEILNEQEEFLEKEMKKQKSKDA